MSSHKKVCCVTQYSLKGTEKLPGNHPLHIESWDCIRASTQQQVPLRTWNIGVDPVSTPLYEAEQEEHYHSPIKGFCQATGAHMSDKMI